MPSRRGSRSGSPSRRAAAAARATRPPRSRSRTGRSGRSRSRTARSTRSRPTIGADVPFFLQGTATRDGRRHDARADRRCRATTSRPARAARRRRKTSTADVYAAFDGRTAPRASRSGGRRSRASRVRARTTSRAPAERSRLLAVAARAARAGGVPRRREGRRPWVYGLFRRAGGQTPRPKRCVRRGRHGSRRRFGKPARRGTR